MKRFLTYFFIFSIVTTVTFSCKKSQITSNDGVWNVDKVVYTSLVMQTESSQIAETDGSQENIGTFTFDGDGTGTYSITLNGVLKTGEFNWKNSGNSISINKIKNALSLSGGIEQAVIDFDGTFSKNSMEFTGSETSQSVSGGIDQFVIEGTFHLSK